MSLAIAYCNVLHNKSLNQLKHVETCIGLVAMRMVFHRHGDNQSGFQTPPKREVWKRSLGVYDQIYKVFS